MLPSLLARIRARLHQLTHGAPVVDAASSSSSSSSSTSPAGQRAVGPEVVPLEPLTDPLAPKAPGAVRVVCISDTHSLHGRMNLRDQAFGDDADNGGAHSDLDGMTLGVPHGDVLIHAGDFSNVGLADDVSSFSAFLQQLPHRHKIVIAGNHDVTFDKDNYATKLFARFHERRGVDEPLDVDATKALLQNCIYLEDQEVTVEGLRIYGSPWQPEFCDWAFNLPRGEAIREKWRRIPEGIDILVTHGPPYGHGDLCADGLRAGCEDLLEEVQERIRPRYHVFGHIHEGYGVSTNGTTVFINASTCTYRYAPTNRPIIFDIVPRSSEQE